MQLLLLDLVKTCIKCYSIKCLCEDKQADTEGEEGKCEEAAELKDDEACCSILLLFLSCSGAFFTILKYCSPSDKLLDNQITKETVYI